jgi:hypothetical protein
VLTLLSGAVPALAAEPAPASAAVTVPDVPRVPANPAFADEVAGRHLLFAARDAYRAAPAVRFSATWRTAALPPNPNRPAALLASGSETVAAQFARKRLNLSSETAAAPAGGAKTVRRVGSDGSTLIATRFEQKDAKAAPAREFVRLPLAEVDDLSDALTLVQVAPATRAARMLLAPDWAVRGVTWRVPGLPATVVEVEPVRGGGGSNGGGRAATTVTRRYKLDPKTRLLLSFEEWTVTGGAAGDADASGRRSRVVYRREDYTGGKNGADAATGVSFAAAAPKGYTEAALPGSESDLPPTHAPAESDPRALALLRRWEQAQSRLLTYSARVRVTAEAANKGLGARPLPEAWQHMNAVYDVSLRRPDRFLVTVRADAQLPPNGFLRPVAAASDGENVTVLDLARPGQAPRTVPLGDNPDALPNRLRQAGFFDGAQALTWLLARPWAVYETADTAAYLGTQTLAETGESVQLVEVTEVSNTRPGAAADPQQNRRRRRPRRRGNGGTEVVTVTRVYLGADGLPRRIERYRSTDVEGSFARDEPPNTLLVARFEQFAVDREIGRDAFVLPTAPAPRTAAAR